MKACLLTASINVQRSDGAAIKEREAGKLMPLKRTAIYQCILRCKNIIVLNVMLFIHCMVGGQHAGRNSLSGALHSSPCCLHFNAYIENAGQNIKKKTKQAYTVNTNCMMTSV